MKKIIYLFLTFMVALSFTYAQQYTKAPFSDNTWKPITINNDGADAIFTDDMNGVNSVAGLEARGWFFDDVDGEGSTTTFQGNIGVFTAYEGPDTGYVGQNFNGAFAGGLLIDQWLISPEVTVAAEDTLKFWHRSPDGSTWPDPLEVWVSSTAGTTAADFDISLDAFNASITGWQQYVGNFTAAGTVRFAVRYYTTDGGPAGNESNYVGMDLFEVESGSGGPTLITIAEAREDLDADFIPDHLGEIVTIEGTISSPNYNTGNFNYVFHDGTAGITSILFGYGGAEYNMGDVVQVTGEITQYSGLTQITPADDAGVVFIGSGGTLPDFTVLTVAQFQADAEMYEGELIAFSTVSGTGGGDPWPTSGSNANFELTDGADLVMMRIDKETDLDENPEPVWPKDVIGFGGQFSTATPPNDGYQLLPRMYSEILPPGTVPVELTSFVASVSENNVTLNWSTATETNNLGFEVQRNSGNDFQAIGFVTGNGTTTETQVYLFTDVVAPGSYSYRLKQVDLDGTFSYSEVIQVEVDVTVPDVFALEQNYPNPFNPSTKINFSLAVDSKVNLKVFDVLGQEVANLISSDLVAGSHNVDFSASGLNSGVYFYRIDATGIDGTNFTSVKKMILTK